MATARESFESSATRKRFLILNLSHRSFSGAQKQCLIIADRINDAIGQGSNRAGFAPDAPSAATATPPNTAAQWIRKGDTRRPYRSSCRLGTAGVHLSTSCRLQNASRSGATEPSSGSVRADADPKQSTAIGVMRAID